MAEAKKALGPLGLNAKKKIEQKLISRGFVREDWPLPDTRENIRILKHVENVCRGWGHYEQKHEVAAMERRSAALPDNAAHGKDILRTARGCPPDRHSLCDCYSYIHFTCYLLTCLQLQGTSGLGGIAEDVAASIQTDRSPRNTGSLTSAQVTPSPHTPAALLGAEAVATDRTKESRSGPPTPLAGAVDSEREEHVKHQSVMATTDFEQPPPSTSTPNVELLSLHNMQQPSQASLQGQFAEQQTP